jgi:hypothetical protein
MFLTPSSESFKLQEYCIIFIVMKGNLVTLFCLVMYTGILCYGFNTSVVYRGFRNVMFAVMTIENP